MSAIETWLRSLEALCGTMERALSNRQWNALDAAIADARRATHGLQNAMDDAADLRDPAFDEDVFRRLRRVHGIREDQMRRLQQYHDAVGERLQLIARWKAAVRSMGANAQPRTISALDGLS